jgi:hypothetical protein
VEDLGGHSDLSRSPLFDVMVQIQDAHTVHEQDAGSLEGLAIRLFEQELQFSKYDLTVNVMEIPGDISVDFEYNSDLFLDESVIRFRSSFIQLIGLLLDKTESTVGDIRLLPGDGQKELMQHYRQSIITDIDEEF